MSLPPLLPGSLWLLFLLWPGVLLAGWGLASRVTTHGRQRALLAPGLAACAWLVTMHVAGRLSQSFTAAVVIGTALPGGIGYALPLWRRSRARAAGKRGTTSGTTTDKPRPPFGPGYSPWMLVTMVIVTALMA